MTPLDHLRPHLWQAFFALQRGDAAHAGEHLKAAMNLADPGPESGGVILIPAEPCLLTSQNHLRTERSG